MTLSILIPTIPSRRDLFTQLMIMFYSQIGFLRAWADVEIIFDDEVEPTIGHKRNSLLSRAKGKYVCFFDDDDEPSSDYLQKILKAVESNPDCCSLMGVITWDDGRPEIFEHSIKYTEYKTTSNVVKYERYPNHLNVIRRNIANRFIFPEINHGEDTSWATHLFNFGILNRESEIEGIIYHYKYRTNKNI